MRAIIVIPTYNERDNLYKLFTAIKKKKPDIDILFVDDNSPDGTGELAESVSKKYTGIYVLHRRRKEGIGKAYIDGFKWALSNNYEAIMQMDADFEHPPYLIPIFLEKIKDYDAVFASRYLQRASIYNLPLWKSLLSRCANKFVRITLGINVTDTTTGFKCFRRNVLESINLDNLRGKTNDFFIELVYKVIKSGFKTVEIPFVLKNRVRGKSKLKPKVFLDCLFMVLNLRICKRI